MTECEKVMVDNLVKEGTIKFYACYVDETLLVKLQDIYKVLKAFKGFDKSLTCIVDKFENETPDFLDLEICLNGLRIFRKNIYTVQYINMDSFLCGNGKGPRSHRLLIEQRKYVQKKTFQKNSNR